MISFLYTFISGLLYSLSFPKASLWYLSFISLVPFFYALDKSKHVWQRLIYGGLWAVVVSGTMGHWMFIALCRHYGLEWAKAGLFFSICLVLPLAAIYGIFSVAYGYLKRDRLVFYAAVIPSLWVAAEFLKESIPVLIPWGNIAYAVFPFKSFVQAADLAGVYGLTFLVVMVNGLLFILIKDIRDKGAGWRRIAGVVCLAAVIFSGVIGYGRLRVSDIRAVEEDTKKVSVTLVQGNFSLEDRWSGMGFYNRVQTYLSMSQGKGGEDGPRIIVWPETTLNSSSRVDRAFFKSLMRAIGPDALLVSGGLKQLEAGGVYNSAYFISGSGRLQRYDKHILLPYAETVPLVDWLDGFYTAPDEFIKGRSPLCFDTLPGRVSTSICFEILYPAYIRQMMKQGAEVLINISNDAWFGESAMPHMHLDAARMRAVEHRRYVLRASNSGISAIIAPDGRIVGRSRLFQREKISGICRMPDQETIYTKYGNWVLYLTAAVLALACLRQIFNGER